MKLYLRDQKARLGAMLPEYRPLPLSYDKDTVLREKWTSIVVRAGVPATDLSSYDFGPLFTYDIFPGSIMSHAAEWDLEGRAMQEGDVIVQQAYLPPLPLSVKMVFGVRVLKVVRGPAKVGFSYGTLQGHPEMGISEFYFSLEEGAIRFTIHTYSYPGTLLTRIVAPIVTLPYQKYCTHRALRHLRRSFLGVNKL